MAQGTTLLDKIWKSHLVNGTQEDGICLIYIDRHLVHEVTSPQAFENLRLSGYSVRQPKKILAVADHNIPTVSRAYRLFEDDSRIQIESLENNCHDFCIEHITPDDIRHGIVHIIGPEQGFSLPGTTVVCGDSHTSTHGAFGTLAFGIGTSEVEHVLVTQTLLQKPAKSMRIVIDGDIPFGVGAKDIILAVIGLLGTAGGTGYVIEYAGTTIRSLSMEGRMTICNMTIEAGARSGLIAPDSVTFSYLSGRSRVPSGIIWEQALAYWRTLETDPDATFNAEIIVDASNIIPYVTWGTSPEDVVPITGRVPDPFKVVDSSKRHSMLRALTYMQLTPGTLMTDIQIDRIFIGSCTNSRIEDLRAAAHLLKGHIIAPNVKVIVVPGSSLIKAQAEAEGLDRVFIDSGCEWRDPGCSMCLAMNADRLEPGERCASTSNRNFEGRQGRDGRTHLLSPSMAAAAALTGYLTDSRLLDPRYM